jgi:hypothetical protein
MRISIYLSSLFFTILLFSNCSPKQYEIGKYQNETIIADGDASDWGLPLRFGSEEGALQYSITNDKENFYISVATNNQQTQMSILRAGLKICFDPKGNKSTDIALVYPYKDPMEAGPRVRNENKNTDPNSIKQKMMLDADIFSTIGFMNMENRIYDLKDTSHFKVGMNFDKYNNLVFEAIVPIKNVIATPINFKKTPSISVGIIINNFAGGGARPNSSGENGNYRSGGEGMGGGMRGGGMGGGRGGMGGGGMGGGRGGMGGGGMGGGGMRGGGMSRGGSYNASKQIINWYQFKLASE